MNPDAATIAAAGPVDIDINELQPGQRIVALWAARPVFVVKRAQPALDELKNPKLLSQLRDPEFAGVAAAYLRRQLEPLDQAGNPGAGRRVHPSRLHSAVRAETRMRQIRLPTGRAASSAPATARNTTSRGACSKGFPRPTICPCRPISSPATRRCASARIRRARASTSTRSCRFRPRTIPSVAAAGRTR